MRTDINYYTILRVDSNATEDQIRRAYRALVREYHPDVNKSAEADEIFRGITVYS
jgi:curved DNA-binding protein CbpA